MNLRTLALSVTMLALAASPVYAQQGNGSSRQDRQAETLSGPESTTPNNWTTDQIVTATVHQAWVLSGKDDATFFEIVRELAEISARNRSLILPDDPAAGRRAGAYIKAQAKADHDQLLYAIVDKSVRMTGKKAVEQAAK